MGRNQKDFVFVFNVAGKRHGKGKGVIFSLSTVGQFAAEHGVYSGEWKRNMRFELLTEVNLTIFSWGGCG